MGRKAKRARVSARKARLLGTPEVAPEPVPVVEAAPVVEEVPVVEETPAEPEPVAEEVKAAPAPIKSVMTKPKTTKTVSRKRSVKKTTAKN